MENVIVILIILVLVLLAVRHIIKEKKKGNVCIGCSNSSQCSHNCNCGQKKKHG